MPESESETTDLDSETLHKMDLQLLRLIDMRSGFVEELAKRNQLPSTGQSNASLAATLDLFCKDANFQRDKSDVDSLRQTLRHIDSHCRNQISSSSVSFLGPRFSYSHLAAIKYFGDAVSFAPVASIPAVFDAVHNGDAASGLVPIENSTDGRVVDTLGMFVRRHMQICGEVLLPIHHNLLASGDRDTITEIHSKPQALSQCRNWLASNFPAATLVEVSSTTAAAESASEHNHIAAVASLPAGRAYDLTVLNQDIEDSSDNVTRFAVLGRDESEPTGNDKTSLLFQLEHQPGALASAMAVFSESELNLTWIESFPCPDTRSEYLFFVELSGHRAESGVSRAVANLEKITRRLEILGSYPVAIL